MYSSVYSTVSYTNSGTITGWSTNGDRGEETTYCYQINNGGEFVQETELTTNPAEAAPAPPAPADAADAPAETPADAAPTPAPTPADAPADAADAPATGETQSTPS